VTGSNAKVERKPVADRPYKVEEQVGHLLRRAYQRHTAIFQAMIGPSQLTNMQFAALVKLHDVGEVSQNQLGRLTAMDAATMQGVIKRLDARGLVNRRPDSKDRRRTLISLSPEGAEVIGEAVTHGHGISEATLEPLAPEESRTLLALLKKIT
jgi:DNA-binding MarR family transcriptional regulator